MKKYLFSMLVLSLLVFAGAKSVVACSCAVSKYKSISRQVKQAYEDSAAVFSGEVLSITKAPDTFYLQVKFKVDKSWKNGLANEVLITTGSGGGDCEKIYCVRLRR